MSDPSRILRRHLLAAAAAPSLGGLVACAGLPTPATAHRMHLVAEPATAALRLPGREPVAVWSYGGTVPGPEIRLVQGSRLRVDFENRLPVPTTVHWHGLRVPNAMDGVPHLTQEPVPPGGRFQYVFDLPDAGTYWYHSHLQSAEQVERGLYGALIVTEPQPLPVDRDLTWLLDDWRLTAEGQLAPDFAVPHDMAHAGRIGNVVTLNGALPRDLPVQRGERLRIRLVNAANARIFALTFDGHVPLVVAFDGQPVTPHAPEGNRVLLAPGMRVDLILDATGQPGESHAVGDLFSPRGAYDLLRLAYGAGQRREQPLPPPVGLPANPLAEPELATARTHEIRFEGGMMGRLHSATLDGQPMNMRGLLRSGKAWALNGVVAAGHEHGHSEAPLIEVRRGQTVRLLLANDTRWHHPIHLHGHSFRVLSRNGRPRPHREWQDTVLMAPEERVEIAFVADNPGRWMLHCHVLEHQQGGMMGWFRVA